MERQTLKQSFILAVSNPSMSLCQTVATQSHQV